MILLHFDLKCIVSVHFDAYWALLHSLIVSHRWKLESRCALSMEMRRRSSRLKQRLPKRKKTRKHLLRRCATVYKLPPPPISDVFVQFLLRCSTLRCFYVIPCLKLFTNCLQFPLTVILTPGGATRYSACAWQHFVVFFYCRRGYPFIMEVSSLLVLCANEVSYSSIIRCVISMGILDKIPSSCTHDLLHNTVWWMLRYCA